MKEILGTPVIGDCLLRGKSILQVPVQEKYKLWIDEASLLVSWTVYAFLGGLMMWVDLWVGICEKV